MKRSMLPLTALRSFEAAGRHQSFKQAAAELHVSDAAVSRQVRDLEVLLGTRLFDRDHRSVKLTGPGWALLASISQSFDEIDAAVSRHITMPSQKVVSVSAEPTFAALFLVPRLNDFAQLYPDIEVQCESSAALVDVSDKPRLAIRHSLRDTSWPRSQARQLLADTLTPMASVKLAGPPLQGPADLAGVRLLRDENDQAWLRWLDAAGIDAPPTWGAMFSNAAIALQGAELGQGVALGSRVLASDLLASGTLYTPFETTIANGAYWLVVPDFRALSATETLFCDWLRDQLGAVVPEPASQALP